MCVKNKETGQQVSKKELLCVSDICVMELCIYVCERCVPKKKSMIHAVCMKVVMSLTHPDHGNRCPSGMHTMMTDTQKLAMSTQLFTCIPDLLH